MALEMEKSRTESRDKVEVRQTTDDDFSTQAYLHEYVIAVLKLEPTQRPLGIPMGPYATDSPKLSFANEESTSIQ